MTDASYSVLAGDPDAGHHALVSLHALAGTFGDVDLQSRMGFIPPSAREALTFAANAAKDDVPVSARLGVLYNLAKANFPEYESAEAEYHLLAESVAGPSGLDSQQLLTDLKQSASEGKSFQATPSGQTLPHEQVAFIGQDVCTTKSVKVGGLAGTWVFSEFETDAPYQNAVGWVDPRNWPERGPALFKRMQLVGSGEPVTITPTITPTLDGHWHGVFHEEVQLVQRINTLLHCDYWRDGDRATGMTYELSLSLDGELNVDRGFLLVTNLGPVRRIKALKIVGFTSHIWDDVAQLVCPFWTDWIRGAVRGGSSSQPMPPTLPPGEDPGTPGSSIGDNLAAWVEFFGDSARTYLKLFQDMTSNMSSQGYSTSDWLADGNKYWSQLAKDWSKAWSYGLDTLEEVAREGLDAGFAPPDQPRAAARGVASALTAQTPRREEGTTIPVPGLTATDKPVSSDLVSIEAGGATIPAAQVTVTVTPVGGGAFGAQVKTANTSVPPGLYVGQLKSPEGTALALIQLYLSRARGS